MTEKTTLTREEFAELISQRNSYYKAWKEAEKKLSEAQAIIEQQKKTFIAALNNATKISSTELQIAERLKAESSPEALESERAANAILTEELEKARAEIERLALEIANKQYTITCASEENQQLKESLAEAQELIKKLRRCANCKHRVEYAWLGEVATACALDVNEEENQTCKNYDKWEAE